MGQHRGAQRGYRKSGLCLANCYFAHNSLGFPALLPFFNIVVLFIHLIAILNHLLQPGGVRSLVAESLLLKHQLLPGVILRSDSKTRFALTR
jgi:hypothetical protein